MKWNHRMFGSTLPNDECRHKTDSNDQWSDDLCLLPSFCILSCNCEWHKDQCKDANQQGDSNDVELPEQSNRESLDSKSLIWSLVFLQVLFNTKIVNQRRSLDAHRPNFQSPSKACIKSAHHMSLRLSGDDI